MGLDGSTPNINPTTKFWWSTSCRPGADGGHWQSPLSEFGGSRGIDLNRNGLASETRPGCRRFGWQDFSQKRDCQTKQSDGCLGWGKACDACVVFKCLFILCFQFINAQMMHEQQVPSTNAGRLHKAVM